MSAQYHYLWGAALFVLNSRVADRVKAAVRVEKNSIDVQQLAYVDVANEDYAPNDYYRYSLGHTLIERLEREEMRARIAAGEFHHREVYLDWFDQLPLAACYRYTLSDGQRLLYIHSALGADYHMLLADTHARNDDPLWKERFPAGVVRLLRTRRARQQAE